MPPEMLLPRPTMERLRRLLPSPDSLQDKRWLRWLGPLLQHPRLWHVSRRGIALGMAIGVFFGLLIPIAQIPVSAAVAVVLRANVPSAIASTLVTNPVTFGPVYYAAWRLGKAVLGEPVDAGQAPPAQSDSTPVDDGVAWWERSLTQLRAVGQALLLGLAIMACSIGLLTYALVSAIWALRVRWRRRRRLRDRPE